jgi:ATP-dependent DNA helicase PIF1
MSLELTTKQFEAFEAMKQGDNVFLTGQAGTGKSVLVSTFIKYKSVNSFVGITSMTGISSILIGGTTLHSFLKIGLGDGNVGDIITRIQSTRHGKKRWQGLTTLIVDEVSMLSPELLTKLEEIGRILRGNNSPFGGIQLIFCGDFLQLPVVGNQKFCFECEAWDRCKFKIMYLTEIMRQNDPLFQKALSKVRMAQIDDEVKEILTPCINRELKEINGVKPTRLYTTNVNVEYLNLTEYNKISENVEECFKYDMQYEFHKYVKDKEDMINKSRKNILAPDTIELCVGAQVMLVYNIDVEGGLANGSKGVVIGFTEEEKLPIVRFTNGRDEIIKYNTWDIKEDREEVLSITQLPLKLAWAITIHKSQGATLDLCIVDLEQVFEFGQVYVALSRVKSLEGLSISNLSWKSIMAHPKAVKFYKDNK